MKFSALDSLTLAFNVSLSLSTPGARRPPFTGEIYFSDSRRQGRVHIPFLDGMPSINFSFKVINMSLWGILGWPALGLDTNS